MHFRPDRQSLIVPENFSSSVVVSDDINILSTDPNDMGQCATLYDALAERTAAAVAYDIAKESDALVTDQNLVAVTKPVKSSALLLGLDPHGTTFIVGLVRTRVFIYRIITIIF